MCFLINILIPVLLFFITYKTGKACNNNRNLIYVLVGSAIIFLLFSTPIIFSGYQYTIWALNVIAKFLFYLSLGLLISVLFYKNKYFKVLLIVTFSLIFIVNAFVEGIALFGSGFGGVEYPKKTMPVIDWQIDDYGISHFARQSASASKSEEYVIYKFLFNNMLYKEVARTGGIDEKECEIIFYKNMGKDAYFFNKCNKTIEYKENLRK